MNHITVFTDGASRGNPGPGGYGIIIYKKDAEQVIEQGGSAKNVTNNQMELKALLEALKLLKNDEGEIIFHIDSSYVLNGVTKWIYGWEKNGWKTSAKTDVENRELWEDVARARRAMKADLVWKKTEGHAGVFGNELADQIATDYADGKRVLLYKGAYAAHQELRGGDILKTSKDEKKSKKKNAKKDTRPPYSYVSMLNGIVETHKTWSECEARVKGKTAKFKKVFSKKEEEDLIQEWTLASLMG